MQVGTDITGEDIRTLMEPGGDSISNTAKQGHTKDKSNTVNNYFQVKLTLQEAIVML